MKLPIKKLMHFTIIMDLEWNDERTRQFTTNVGLITSFGPRGHNVMSAEWTHHVSYSPSLIAACINKGDATNENIRKTKEFGVNLCATEQSVMASVAGGSSGRDVDKIAALKDLGFTFYTGKKIKALMIGGAALNAECRLMKIIELGDHTTFVGEVLELSADLGRKPLIYHQGKFWKIGERIKKPLQEELDNIEKLVGKFRK